ncbi:protein transport protein Sec24B isoform X2 [Falco biarmicus]|uniref:protein transport protein Sec24B isoform X2 n=1 Tax=Falco rusticolus TaxID=120794 RepID=UPI0018865230|nr:protein transport protein Sec24B isoform X2 [Falco rusticolus]XP_055558357.1 protein transport protein Sec24B isoform X2 [Falco cherrug]XP_056189038.1 protein transport protein Sec24B isoform X2 [Falco biarmicus]
MSAPAGLPPRPAGAAAAAVYPGGPGASREAAAPPSGAPGYQNGPVQNWMQFPSGYGSHPPNYSAPSGHYSQVPNKAAASHLDNQYRASYYRTYYSSPAQNVMTPSVGTSVLNTQESQQLYNKTPHTVGSAEGPVQGAISSASYLHTSAQQSYSAFGNHYSTSVSSSVASQGFPLNSDHYAMPVVSSAVYPNVSYPPAAPGSVYGQAFTSQSLPVVGQVKETNKFSSQSTSVPHSLQQHVPVGYNTTLSTTSSAQSVQDNLCSNLTRSVAKVNNQINTGGIDSSQPVHSESQSVSFTKPGAGTSASSAVISSVRTPAPSLSSQPRSSPSVPQSPELALQEAIDSSSTTSSASPVLNNYDALEGGGYPETRSVTSSPVPAPSVPQTSKASKPFGYGYPTLQPGYQNAAAPTPVQPSNPGHHPGLQHYPQQYPGVNQLTSSIGGLSLQHSQQPESLRPVNLTQDRNILPVSSVPAPVPNLNSDLRKLNCSPDSFRCTLTNIPQTQALLNKAKLPLGLLLHPFRDLTQLPVITTSTIVRCRSCRTYINPFVSFIDQRRWKCNLCYRVNDVPEEFMYNPLTRSYGEPHKRPEVQNSTVELIASSDYMLRPPQPAVYLFVLDVSHNAVEAGYLTIVCQSLLENLDKLPGDSRTRIGFITFDSTVQFYNLQEGLSQPQMLIVSDIDDIFLPTPDSLLVNLHESKELIKDLLNALPNMFTNTRETHSALGPALQAAFKLMSPTGGRISVFQTQLPSLGAGLLHSREDPNQRSSTKVVQHLGPATDFYKKLALDCSGQQTAVDLFLLSSQYSDLASLACVSKYSAGCIYYYPSFHHSHNPAQAEKLQKDLKRYLTRKIGFEAVMRIRCTKGLSIHTFHGNFFVRSTDLLSLANVNPDAGFAVQMSIEESLTDTSLVCFQTALLYTSSKGERRIRVHTLCLPVVSSLAEVYAGADVQAVVCLLANMAVDRSVSSSLADARDALVNAVVDSLAAYMSTASNLQQSMLIAPNSLKLFPLYILALLKQKAFRTGTSTRLDDRVYAMCQMKSQPLVHLMKMIHPNLYRIDKLIDESTIHVNDRVVPQPPLQKLSAEKLTREGAFLMDCGSIFYIWIGKNCDNNFIKDVLGYPNYASVPQTMTQLPEVDALSSERTRSFISWLRDSRPLSPVLQVIKDENPAKTEFFQHLIEDRTEAAFSYYEFLLNIQQQVCK